MCAALFEGVTAILDMTWTGWDQLRKIAVDNAIIYRRADAAIIPYVQAVDDLLIMKKATDVALIFENERGSIKLFIKLMAKWFCGLFTKKFYLSKWDWEIFTLQISDLNLTLYYLIGHSIIRLVVIDELSEVTVAKVRAMRPSPSYYAIYAKTANMEDLFKTVRFFFAIMYTVYRNNEDYLSAKIVKTRNEQNCIIESISDCLLIGDEMWKLFTEYEEAI